MTTHKLPHLLLLLTLAISLISPTHAQCTSQTFTNNKKYQMCVDLSQLNAALHYTYDSTKSSLSIAFVAPPATPDGWIAWAINPTGTGMLGSQAIIAFKDYNNANMVIVKTYNIQSYVRLSESKLAFNITQASAEFSDGVMKIFATLLFPAGWNMTTVNHVWQVGASVSNGVPDAHAFSPANMLSKGTLDLLSGQATSSTSGHSIITLKNIHGILNAVSWGTLFPLGIMITRYMRFFPVLDPLWFYLHITCQLSAYVIGIAGWGTGVHLGARSKGITYTCHRNVGMALFSLATVQISSALLFRPKKDSKYRIYWNVLHYLLGYLIAILGVVNVFKGLNILDPDKIWRTGYIGVIGALGGIALCLEIVTWIMVLRRRMVEKNATNHTMPI